MRAELERKHWCNDLLLCTLSHRQFSYRVSFFSKALREIVNVRFVSSLAVLPISGNGMKLVLGRTDATHRTAKQDHYRILQHTTGFYNRDLQGFYNRDLSDEVQATDGVSIFCLICRAASVFKIKLHISGYFDPANVFLDSENK